MSEIAKTVTFVIAGCVFLGVAWVARPAVLQGTFDDSGERFFAEFDPLDATRLEILEFDELTGQPDVFQVAQVDGLWSLPSRDNYPADAKDQLARAAASIVDLIKSPMISDSPADHELYGVLDPTAASVGATGVGTRVTLQDAQDDVIADLIIGKEVRDRPDLRYVRAPGRHRVYTTAVSLNPLSTKFEDWIERDLLLLAPADIRRVVINDYSIDEFSNQIIQRDVLGLNWNPDDREWTLDDLSEGQELIPATINAMKFALDDLDIVDVFRKPTGLSAGLRAEEQLQVDAVAIGSLRTRGYFIHEGRLISNEGEMTVATVDGVVYTLRFGEIALGTGSSGADDEAAGALDAGANRYLFVTARFDPETIPPPEFAEIPDFNLESLGMDGTPSSEDEEVEDGEDKADDSQQRIKDAVELARTRIEQENAQKQAEHEEKLAAGRAKVTQLNDRFADWYYVIPDSAYQKLRVTRADVVKDVAPKSEDQE